LHIWPINKKFDYLQYLFPKKIITVCVKIPKPLLLIAINSCYVYFVSSSDCLDERCFMFIRCAVLIEEATRSCSYKTRGVLYQLQNCMLQCLEQQIHIDQTLTSKGLVARILETALKISENSHLKTLLHPQQFILKKSAD